MASRMGLHRHELAHGLWAVLGVRRALFVALSLVVMQLAVASAAQASSNFYWYGAGNSTCWQTGQPGAPSEACDSVGSGYLPTPGGHTGGLEHMLDDSNGGIGIDFTLSPNGDYCSYYGIGDQLTQQDATNEGPATGFTTPTPYSAYQERDSNGSACQAYGNHWGQVIRSGVSGSRCATNTCGMHRYVSLRAQSDRPWSEAFGAEPALVLSTEAGIQTFAHSGSSYFAWGYVCPELEDTATHGVLEYCFQEWRSANNEAVWKNERIGECNNPWSMVQTFFYPGTQYATEMSGSANTWEVGSAGSAHYETKITKANLINAIRLTNKPFVEEHPGTPITGAGCGWGLSENPANYVLIGVEQGMEGGHGLTELAGNGANLQLRTEFASYASPTVTTGEASGVKETEATLNGSVTPNGTDTHYYFEYGPTTSYGSSTSHDDAGSGTNSVSESATASGLSAGTTYHYRLVAENAGGRREGTDQTFKTPISPPAWVSDGWVVSTSGGSNQWVYYRGSEGVMHEKYWNGSSWATSSLGGQAVASGTTPSVVYDQASGQQWVEYTGANNALWQFYWNGTSWTNKELGGSIAAGTSPVAAGNPVNGSYAVYYHSSEGTIQQKYWSQSGGWAPTYNLGGKAAATGTSPTVLYDPVAGQQWVWYTGSNNAVWQFYTTNGTSWTNKELGGSVAAGTSPSAISDPNRSQFWVFYTSSTNQVANWMWTTSNGWQQGSIGGNVAAGSSPSATLNPKTNNWAQWVFYTSSTNQVYNWMWTSSNGWQQGGLGGAVTPSTSPDAVYDEATGQQWVYYYGSNGQIWHLYWNGATWKNSQI